MNMEKISKTPATHISEELLLIWEKRAVLMCAFGIVGIGALVGVGSVYASYIKHRLAEHFRIQSVAGSKVHHGSKQMNKNSIDAEIQSSKDTESSTTCKLTTPEVHNIGSDSSDGGDIKDGMYIKDTTTTNVCVCKCGTRIIPGKKELEKSSFTKQNRLPDLPIISKIAEESPLIVSAADDELNRLQQFYQNIDELLEGSKSSKHEAYMILKAKNEKLGNRFDFLWRFSQATHIESVAAAYQQDTEAQKSLLLDAVSYAEAALKLNDNSADAHKWYAITLGNHSEFLKIKDRILIGFKFKEHIERAISLNPQDSSLHHLLGRFCFEVSQLSWMERKMAATLFSSPPTATVPEALGHFLESESLGKPTVENRLYIAKCYISMSDNKKAAYYLNLALSLTADSLDEKKAQKAATDLMPKYRKYL